MGMHRQLTHWYVLPRQINLINVGNGSLTGSEVEMVQFHVLYTQSIPNGACPRINTLSDTALP